MIIIIIVIIIYNIRIESGVCSRVFVWLVLMAPPPVCARTEYTYTYMGKCLFLSCHHDLNGSLCAPYFAVHACLTGRSLLFCVVVVVTVTVAALSASMFSHLHTQPRDYNRILRFRATPVNEYKWYTLAVLSIP